MANAFSIRGFNLCESLLRHTPEQLRKFLKRMKQWNLNTLIVQYDYGWKRYQNLILEECANYNINIILMVFGPRTFFKLSSWKREYFAKNEAGDPFFLTPACELQPCGSNPEALEAFQAGAEKFFQSLPKQICHVHMRSGDGYFFCRCPKCLSKSCRELWTPFIRSYIAAGRKIAPEIKLEADVYNRRYGIPKDAAPYHQLDQMMFDTFFRNPNFSLTQTDGEPPDLQIKGLIDRDEEYMDASLATTLTAQRLKEWCNFMPNKIYIHENAMQQSNFGVFHHNTNILLQDLSWYKKLGILGVCYEAYEPGFQFFEESFSTLATALNNHDTISEYQSCSAEIIASNPKNNKISKMWMKQFPIEMISNSVERKLFDFFRNFNWDPQLSKVVDFIRYSLEHKDQLDYLYSGFTLLRRMSLQNFEPFSTLKSEDKEFIEYRKLWDYMEELPIESDPAACVCERIESIISQLHKY